ncbi:MAG: PEP-CTERM sorting domain-containing protein [Rhodanobacter sp.]
MNRLQKQIGITATLMLGMLFAGAASATVVMNFDQLNQNGEYVNDYYNGGCGGAYLGSTPTCGGPNYGIEWSNNTLAGGAPNGPWSNTANEPSLPNVIDFTSGTSAYMNVAAGFTTGFSFYYSSPYYTGSIAVYDGLNGTGTVLANLTLPETSKNCDGFTQNYSCWVPIGVAFSGMAQSVSFGGTFIGSEGYIVFDDVTLGSDTPVGPPVGVPEPADLAMFGLGLLLIGLFAGLRRRYD